MAATKTFATQMVSQYLVALYLAQVRGSKFPEEIGEVLADLDELPEQGGARDRPRRPGARARRAIPARRGTCSSSGATPDIRRRSKER